MVMLDVIFWNEDYEEIVIRDVDYEDFDKILGDQMERFYLLGGHEADVICEPDVIDKLRVTILKNRLILKKILAFTTVIKHVV